MARYGEVFEALKGRVILSWLTSNWSFSIVFKWVNIRVSVILACLYPHAAELDILRRVIKLNEQIRSAFLDQTSRPLQAV
jgi:hypothetical protein